MDNRDAAKGYECPICKGTGKEDGVSCALCGGSGSVPELPPRRLIAPVGSSYDPSDDAPPMPVPTHLREAVLERAREVSMHPLDPRLQHHLYGGVEHRSTDPVEGCLLCTLEAVARAWFSFDQQSLDSLLHEYRKEEDGDA